MKRVALLILALGCARDPAMKRWTDEVEVTERMLDDGQTESARAEFARLEKLAMNAADVRLMRMRQAEALQREKRWDEADAHNDSRRNGDFDDDRDEGDDR